MIKLEVAAAGFRTRRDYPCHYLCLMHFIRQRSARALWAALERQLHFPPTQSILQRRVTLQESEMINKELQLHSRYNLIRALMQEGRAPP